MNLPVSDPLCVCVGLSTVFLKHHWYKGLYHMKGFCSYLSQVMFWWFRVGELLWSLVVFAALLQWGSVQGRICIHHVRHEKNGGNLRRHNLSKLTMGYAWSVYTLANKHGSWKSRLWKGKPSPKASKFSTRTGLFVTVFCMPIGGRLPDYLTFQIAVGFFWKSTVSHPTPGGNVAAMGLGTWEDSLKTTWVLVETELFLGSRFWRQQKTSCQAKN